MTTKQKSAFQEWFVAQHGARPSGLPLGDLELDYGRKYAAAQAAHTLLDKTQQWDCRKESALYAWTARKTK